MKKVAILLAVLTIAVLISGCGGTYDSLKSFKVDGYIEAPANIFSTSSTKQNLDNTLMYVDGKVTKIVDSFSNTPTPAYYVETSNGQIVFLITEYTNHWKDIKVGDNIRTYFLYAGILEQAVTGFYIDCIDPKNIPTVIPNDLLLAKAKYSKPVTEPTQVPKYVQDIYNSFDRVLAMGNFSISLEKGSLRKTNDIGNYAFAVSNERYFNSIVFLSNGSATRNAFYTESVIRSNRGRAEELITLFLMATEPNQDRDSVIPKVKDIADSYRTEAPSNVILSGDYYVFIASNMQKEITAVHKDEMFLIDKTKYVEFDFEKIVLNQSVFVYGTVMNIKSDWNGILGTNYVVTLISNNGKEYSLKYNFDDFPMGMKVGDKYTAYGIVSKNENGKVTIKLEKVVI